MISRRALLAGGMAGLGVPGVARGQRAGRVPRIGVLWHAGNVEEESPYYESLAEGLRNARYVEGRTIAVEHRFPDEKPEQFAGARDPAGDPAPGQGDRRVSGGEATTCFG